MVTQPAPVDRDLTVHHETTIRQLAEYTTRLLQNIATSRADERAYAELLAESATRVGHRTCWIVHSAINPGEQTRILALARPWLHEIRERLEARTRTETGPDGTSRTVAEWPFDHDNLTRLTQQADAIAAEAVNIDE